MKKWFNDTNTKPFAIAISICSFLLLFFSILFLFI